MPARDRSGLRARGCATSAAPLLLPTDGRGRDPADPVDSGSGSHGCTACKYALCRMGTLMELEREGGQGRGQGQTCSRMLHLTYAVLFMHMPNSLDPP